MEKVRGLSSFSVILIMVALMAIGAAMIPLLTVKLHPSSTLSTIDVGCSWGGASSSLMEREVISKLEGALARIKGVKEIASVSHPGDGSIKLTFEKGTNMQVARFEVAQQVRYIYPSLPEGVSYPGISSITSGTWINTTAVSYTFNTNLPGNLVADFFDKELIPLLSKVPGVDNIYYGGINSWEYELTVDVDKSTLAGISMDDIASAFNDHFGESIIGNVHYGENRENVILVKARNAASSEYLSIPVKNKEGRIYLMGDFVSARYKESLPGSYSRINGLNTINLNVAAGKDSNIALVSASVQKRMAELEKSFPQGLSATLAYDAANHINNELQTILLRTLMTLVILMLFVFIVSRNLRYLLIIFLTLLANILVAVVFYYAFNLQIHIYSLAGITVSLGIIIDTSIIMTDHYSYYHDKKAFTALLGAILTTIAALSVVLLLPERHRITFTDFAWVIIINLAVSLVISFLFIPSLIDKLKLKRSMTVSSRRSKKRVLKANKYYSRFILWGRRHKWVFILLFVLGFGIPIHILPTRIETPSFEKPTKWSKFYNQTIGSEFYQKNKKIPEMILGGSLRLFQDPVKQHRFSNNNDGEVKRPKLYIEAAMVEGNTVHQLNLVIRSMENYLSQYDEIEIFRTRVNSYNNSQIEVMFKPEHEHTSFPHYLYDNVRSTVNKSGGATWKVWGIGDQSFDNNIASAGLGYLPNRITLTGYNYDYLYQYAEELLARIADNRRVSDQEIYDEQSWQRPKQEFVVELDRQKVFTSGVNPGAYFSRLQNLLYSRGLRSMMVDDEMERFSIVSSNRESFDLWHVRNFPLDIDSAKIKLSDIGHIERKASGRSIHRKNQNYQLTVAFDFIGSYELTNRFLKSETNRLNKEVLPLGYHAEIVDYRGWSKEDKQLAFLLIVLVIVLIYSIGTILFESWRKSLVIILMIPVSFIGVFLTFGLFGFSFNDGGFAAFVLLSGLVVNAGIYIINDFNNISRNTQNPDKLGTYMKAYNRKIVPILLTILSTVLGLIPFLINGKDNQFWFSFAVGTMGGMVFSIIAFIVYLPIFLPLKKK